AGTPLVVDRPWLELSRHVEDARRRPADRSREPGRDERPPLVLLADEAVDAIAERSDRLSREAVHPWIDGALVDGDEIELSAGETGARFGQQASGVGEDDVAIAGVRRKAVQHDHERQRAV